MAEEKKEDLKPLHEDFSKSLTHTKPKPDGEPPTKLPSSESQSQQPAQPTSGTESKSTKE